MIIRQMLQFFNKIQFYQYVIFSLSSSPAGCPMYIISNHDIYDPVQLCKFLKENEITRMLFSPSLLETVIETDGLDFTDQSQKNEVSYTEFKKKLLEILFKKKWFYWKIN